RRPNLVTRRLNRIPLFSHRPLTSQVLRRAVGPPGRAVPGDRTTGSARSSVQGDGTATRRPGVKRQGTPNPGEEENGNEISHRFNSGNLVPEPRAARVGTRIRA